MSTDFEDTRLEPIIELFKRAKGAWHGNDLCLVGACSIQSVSDWLSDISTPVGVLDSLSPVTQDSLPTQPCTASDNSTRRKIYVTLVPCRGKKKDWRPIVDSCPRYCLGYTQQEQLQLGYFAQVEIEEIPCKFLLKEKEGRKIRVTELELEVQQLAQEKKKLEHELECGKLRNYSQEKKIRELELEVHQLALEKKGLEVELEWSKLKLERQAHQIQAQGDQLSKIELIMEDTDKILASLGNRQTKIRSVECSQPEERGPCYWIFHKYQPGITNAFKTSLIELAHNFAREEVISMTMEKYIVENKTTPSGQKADELMKAVQFALDGNLENFWKVVNVLKISENPVCKRLGNRLALEYQLSNDVDLRKM